MGGGDKQFICNDKKNKTAGSSFVEAMGFGSVTLKNDESELDNLRIQNLQNLNLSSVYFVKEN